LGNPRPNTMAKGEAMTPTPEGVITTTDILQPAPEATEFAEAVLKLDDEKLVEVIEVKEE
jgi:hypothetical protein